MIRSVCFGGLTCLALGLAGCTSLLTARAIESFTTELAAGNLAGLQETTSTGFQERALRADGALESLKVLPLPTEEGKVITDEEISPTERLVTMQIGKEPKIQTVKYQLKREAATAEGRARWVVDDIILVRDRGEGQAPQTKSLTEQMDVLLTAQEFMTSWKGGGREETLALLHPELRQRLESLSGVHLAQITNEMLDGLKDDTFRPEARIQPAHAVVLLPRRSGKLQLDLEHDPTSPHRWMIRDIVRQSSRQGEPDLSVAHLAGTVGQAADFLNAYQSQDHKALQEVSTEAFYAKTLSTADFSTAPLPVPQLLASRFVIEEQDQRTDLVFELGDDTYLISMSRTQQPDVVLPEQRSSESPCRVDEVTVYERGGAQIKPLSVVFSAQAVVEVFAESLAQRDLALVTELSTQDLNRRVWSRLAAPELMRSLPLEDFPAAEPKIVTTIFQGPVTEITVTQGTRALTYVLHATNGRPEVDDIKYPSNNRAGSLKTALESVVPVYNFVWAWTRGNKQELERHSSDGVRRMVWMRSGSIPTVKAPLDMYLGRSLPRIEEHGRDQLLTFGPADHGMVVRLVHEEGRLVVEDLHLVDAALAGGRLEFINSLRNWITQYEGVPAKRVIPSNDGIDDRMQSATQLAELPSAIQAEATSPSTAPSAPATTLPLLQQPITIPGT
ncbi:MAG: hypothetical protein ACK5Q5_11400 [Planctomycetaceae bacterium]